MAGFRVFLLSIVVVFGCFFKATTTGMVGQSQVACYSGWQIDLSVGPVPTGFASQFVTV
jgi:hypothetical protein